VTLSFTETLALNFVLSQILVQNLINMQAESDNADHLTAFKAEVNLSIRL